ncbi:MAG: 3-keto-5-aminohexanoate cleavage protein [Gammaproteobacteria bacterium]|nr:3-keto-5-aminohexanoate cleavage protein [Gammaproteobacteria bacterium]NNM10868.1 3-keto-5-aminohexanoate cleavage protein [Pseudomonadales bacterium]
MNFHKSKQQAVWLEVALNGATGQSLQPNIPVEVDDIIAEGIACAGAGAAIIHLHAYDKHGKPTEDADIYSRIIEGIRAGCDAIVYPTLALGGSVEQRIAPLRILAERGLLEWMVVDPGSVNITHALQAASDIPGFVYSNPDEHIAAGLALCEAFKLRPAYAIYEPGFARLGAAMASRYKALQTPVYRVMFSDNLLFGSTPNLTALAFYASHLDSICPGAPRMISGLDADISSISKEALQKGFHLRAGLEDAPLGCDKSNIQLLEETLALVQQNGTKLATAAEIRGQ